MSRLDDFLSLPDVDQIRKEVKINDRIGTVTIQAMTEQTFQNYRNRAKLAIKNNSVTGVDKLNLLIVVGQMVDPDFSNAEFLRKAGFATATDFVSKKFLAGEVATIADEIIKLSGFDSDINEEVEEAKN